MDGACLNRCLHPDISNLYLFYDSASGIAWSEYHELIVNSPWRTNVNLVALPHKKLTKQIREDVFEESECLLAA